MRRIDTMAFLNGINRFKTITDEHDTQYVVFEDCKLNYVTGIKDKTEFEAIETHKHIMDNISPREFKRLIPIAESLGDLLLCCLKHKYPDKDFVVYASLSVRDSLIIRFHQKWKDEAPYYEPNDFAGSYERVFMFEG